MLHRISAFTILTAFGFSALADPAAGPGWWYQEAADRSVVDRERDAENRGMANIGQAKWVAIRALEELEQVLPEAGARVRTRLLGGEGQAGIINADPPLNEEQREAQKAPLLLGQLKSISQPFYDELYLSSPNWLTAVMHSAGTLNAGSVKYPWNEASPNSVNKQVANIGQLKAVFAIDFHQDTDGDGFLDLREEALAGVDEDGDGISDGEDAYPLDRFNGEPPLLVASGEWSVRVSNSEGNPISNVRIEFLRWPAGTAEQSAVLFGEAVTDSAGSCALDPQLLQPGERAIAVLKASPGQRVFMPWREGVQVGDPNISPGGDGLTSQLVQDVVNTSGGVGQAPDFGPGASPGNGEEEEEEEVPLYRLIDFLTFENTFSDPSGDWALSSSPAGGNAVNIAAFYVDLWDGQAYFFSWLKSTVANFDILDPFDPPSMGGGIAITGSSDFPEEFSVSMAANFSDPAGIIGFNLNVFSGVGPLYGAGPYTLHREQLTWDSSYVFLNDGGDVDVTGVDCSYVNYGPDTVVDRFLVAGPVPARLPEPVLTGREPFWYRDIKDVKLGAELPFGFPPSSAFWVNKGETYGRQWVPNKVVWTVEIIEGGGYCEVSANGAEYDPTVSRGTTLESYNVIEFRKINENGVPPESIRIRVSAHLAVPISVDEEGLYAQTPLGSYETLLKYAGQRSAGKTASRRQSEQIRGRVEEGSAMSSSDFNGGQRVQTLEAERKVGMDGRPSPSASTYIDSLTKRFHHSDTDFSLSVPGSDLVLAVSRSASEAIWTKAFGLRPNEDPLRPFGAGWSGNLGASVVKQVNVLEGEEQSSESESPFKGSFTVTDYRGNRFGFFELESEGGNTFVPDPTMLPDASSTNISLACDGVDLVLSQPVLGITHRFKPAGLHIELPGNRDLMEGSGKVRHDYYRVHSVADRLGNQLKWQYGASGESLIPEKIYVEGRPELQIRFQQGTGADAGRLLAFWDPAGVKHSYQYGDDTAPMQSDPVQNGPGSSGTSGQRVLLRHAVGGQTRSSYGYYYLEEADPRPDEMLWSTVGENPVKYRIPTYHLALDRLRDGLQNEWKINYSLSTVREAYSNAASDFYPVAGDPMVVTSVISSDNQTATIGGMHRLRPAAGGQPADMSIQTLVTDHGGGQWTYDWGTPETLVWTSQLQLPSSQARAIPTASALFFPWMSRRCTSVDSSRVTYRYDKAAGYSAHEIEDADGRKVLSDYSIPSGQTASPVYASPTMQRPNGSTVGVNSQATLPRSITDTQGRTTTFTYAGNWRPTRVKDSRDRIVETVFNPDYRPTSVRIWVNEGAIAASEPLVETTFGYDAGLRGVVIRIARKAGGALSGDDPEWVEDLDTTIQIDSGGLGWPAVVGHDANGDGDLADAGDLATVIERSAAGRVLSVRAPNGGESTNQYDASGQLESRYRADGARYQYQYDGAGRLAIVTDPIGRASGISYDPQGRVVARVRDLNGNLGLNATASELVGVDSGIDVVSTVQFLDSQRETRVTDPKGYVRVAKYDALMRPSKVILPNNDSEPGLIPVEPGEEATPADGYLLSWDYSPDVPTPGPVRTVDPLGYETLYHYDQFGRLDQILRQYGADGNNEALYQKVGFGFDAHGLPDRVTTVRTPFDADGAPVGVGPVQSIDHRVYYDVLDRVSESVMAEGTPREIRSKNAYTSTGLLWRREARDQIGTNGAPDRWVAMESRFDALGRVIRQTLPEVFDERSGTMARPFTEFEYGTDGGLESITDSYGATTSFAYDAVGNLSYRSGPRVREGIYGQWKTPVTRYRYDAAGRTVEVTEPRSNPWTYDYDDAQRRVRVTGPVVDPMAPPEDQRAIAEYYYDLAGNLERLVDPEGHLTEFGYDANGRQVEKLAEVTDTDPAGNATVSTLRETSKRDALGRILEVEDGLSQLTRFTYDGLGRLTSRTWDPDDARLRTETTLYDALLPVASADAKGQTSLFEYDERFMLEELNLPASPSEDRTFQYDDVGRLLHVTGGNLSPGLGDPSVGYTYDILGRLSGETSNGVTQSYGYDLNGNMARISSEATNRVLKPLYDEAGRVVRLDDQLGGSTTSTSFGYDLAGHLTEERMANGLIQVSDYDSMGRIVSKRLRTQNKSVLCRSDYDYDLNSNVTGLLETTKPFDVPDRSVVMGYDELGRLVSEEQMGAGLPQRTERHRYDLAGNRNSSRRVTGSGAGAEVFDRAFSYGAHGTPANSNQLLSITEQTTVNGVPGSSVSTDYTYDANGNRKTRSRGGSTDILDYDSFDRLIQLEVATSTTGENGVYRYSYDHASRRIGRHAPGQPDRHFSFQGSSPAVEWTPGSGAGLFPGLVENVGGGVGGRLYAYEGGAPTFPFHDSRGDVVAQASAGGALTYRGLHDGSGKIVTTEGSRMGGYGANSKWEEPLGLVNDGYRYRDRDTGSFISRDPAGFVDGPNVYSYVRQNPWSAFDPNGLSTVILGSSSDIGYVASTTYEPPPSDPVSPDPFDAGSPDRAIERISRDDLNILRQYSWHYSSEQAQEIFDRRVAKWIGLALGLPDEATSSDDGTPSPPSNTSVSELMVGVVEAPVLILTWIANLVTAAPLTSAEIQFNGFTSFGGSGFGLRELSGTERLIEGVSLLPWGKVLGLSDDIYRGGSGISRSAARTSLQTGELRLGFGSIGGSPKDCVALTANLLADSIGDEAISKTRLLQRGLQNGTINVPDWQSAVKIIEQHTNLISGESVSWGRASAGYYAVFTKEHVVFGYVPPIGSSVSPFLFDAQINKFVTLPEDSVAVPFVVNPF